MGILNRKFSMKFLSLILSWFLFRKEQIANDVWGFWCLRKDLQAVFIESDGIQIWLKTSLDIGSLFLFALEWRKTLVEEISLWIIYYVSVFFFPIRSWYQLWVQPTKEAQVNHRFLQFRVFWSGTLEWAHRIHLWIR